MEQENDQLTNVLKSLATRPVVQADQLTFDGIRKFLVVWETWQQRVPGAKMRDSIVPGAWRALKMMSAFHSVDSGKISNNALGALLFQVYGPKTSMATLDYLRDLGMSSKLKISAKVDMPALVKVISDWQFLYRWVLPDRRPTKKEAFKVFCESVGPPGQVEELKASVAETGSIPSINTIMNGFVMFCEEAVAAHEKELSLLKALERKRKADHGGVDDVSVKKALISLIGSGDKQLLKSLSSVVTSAGGDDTPVVLLSKNQRKKARKAKQLNQAASNGSSSTSGQPVRYCYGCGEVGHTRDKCPNSSRVDFVSRKDGKHKLLNE